MVDEEEFLILLQTMLGHDSPLVSGAYISNTSITTTTATATTTTTTTTTTT